METDYGKLLPGYFLSPGSAMQLAPYLHRQEENGGGSRLYPSSSSTSSLQQQQHSRLSISAILKPMPQKEEEEEEEEGRGEGEREDEEETDTDDKDGEERDGDTDDRHCLAMPHATTVASEKASLGSAYCEFSSQRQGSRRPCASNSNQRKKNFASFAAGQWSLLAGTYSTTDTVNKGGGKKIKVSPLLTTPPLLSRMNSFDSQEAPCTEVSRRMAFKEEAEGLRKAKYRQTADPIIKLRNYKKQGRLRKEKDTIDTWKEKDTIDTAALDLLVSAAIVVFGNQVDDQTPDPVEESKFAIRAGGNRSARAQPFYGNSAIVKRKVIRRARSAFKKQNAEPSVPRTCLASEPVPRLPFGSRRENGSQEIEVPKVAHVRNGRLSKVARITNEGPPPIQFDHQGGLTASQSGLTEGVLQSLQKYLKSKISDNISEVSTSSRKRKSPSVKEPEIKPADTVSEASYSGRKMKSPSVKEDEIKSKEDETEEDTEDASKTQSSGTTETVVEVDAPLEVKDDGDPIIRTMRGRSQVLPSKFSDSVLQPWRKRTRRRLKSKLS